MGYGADLFGRLLPASPLAEYCQQSFDNEEKCEYGQHDGPFPDRFVIFVSIFVLDVMMRFTAVRFFRNQCLSLRRMLNTRNESLG